MFLLLFARSFCCLDLRGQFEAPWFGLKGFGFKGLGRESCWEGSRDDVWGRVVKWRFFLLSTEEAAQKLM